MAMRALVTGGAGFIGSNVARLLASERWPVRIVDNLSSGCRANLAGLKAEFIEGDIRDQALMQRACRAVDVVLHLAACVGRQRSLENPQQDADTNLLGTISVLEAMRRQRVRRIVYASSAAVFGELQAATVGEEHPQAPDSPYGVTKLAAEKMILAYAALYGFTAVSLRYFNIYGRNQRYDQYGNVIPIFARQLFNSRPLVIYGDGEQTRDFVNVADVARANYLAALYEGESAVFNIGSGVAVTINQLADFMKQISGHAVSVRHVPPRAADVRYCRARTDRARRLLAFEAAVPLTDGLRDYLAWFRRHGQENGPAPGRK